MNYESTMRADLADAETRSSNRRRLLIIGGVVALLVVAAILFAVFGRTSAPAADGKPADAAQQPVVSVIAPGAGSVTQSINATGTLAARRDIAVGVVGEGGQVSRITVEANAFVTQGQVLASIDRSVQVQQAAALDAQVGVARADLSLAQSELDRAQQLVARGFVSKADIDRKAATRDGAAARLRAAQAQASEIRARNARLDIRAPVSGVILERMVQPGQVVGAGSGPLFRMASGGEMELQARLSEADLARVSVGTMARVTPVGTDRSFTGRIWEVAPVIDPQTRQGIARIALPFDRALRPGGFAAVEIVAGQVTAPVLPESAVQSDNQGSFVYIVGKGNKVERRAITTGDVTPAGITIASGLTGTEKVVLFAGGFLNPGETVQPRLQKAPAPR